MSTVALQVTNTSGCVDYHRTMAATLAAGDALNRGASILSIAKDFWLAAHVLKALVAATNRITQAPHDELATFIVNLESVHSRVNALIDRACKKGLARRRIISFSIQSLRLHNEGIKDAIERLRLTEDREIRDAALEAIAEHKRGETVSLESLL